ncbi:NAD(P)/FAD-dependent oxidoreductase [Chryseobacterium sediminis]|uniref:NAD(P)/FAD-dependent oxidoreductase n=1 Tax=Chryseobacterium sediminis TaxID=1679494 RepID=UPI002863D0CC|nr:NAD(P)/FAD-dependent oxidoreductase [Chryseobacterium sediminis]MDR6462589.1 NADH dehydrogenase [Chryseobacterium sediminis]
MTKRSKHIVIIGGGFAGINLIRSLANHPDYHITLVDKNNYNFFPPLIYQVATSVLEPSSISFPFRKLFSGYHNFSFWMGEFRELISDEKKILLSNGELSYDYLVFATGTVVNYFGMENIEKNAIPMKTLDDALNMRNVILQRLENAVKLKDEEKQKRTLSIVVAGGGPTGVEIAGMLAEVRQFLFKKEYPELKQFEKLQDIYLVDGGTSLLTPMSERSQTYTYQSLEKLGVKIKLNTQITDFDGAEVKLKNGTSISSKNLIWAAGVQGSIIEGIPETSYGRGNRLLVNELNAVTGLNEVYAIGDICLYQQDQNFPDGHPQMAQPAIQQAKNLGENFKRMTLGLPGIPFTYNDKGSMAIIGRNKAVADLPSDRHFKGFTAWFLWIFVHLMSLINYRNRLKTFYNWSVAYFTKDQPLRLIIRPSRKISSRQAEIIF